MIHNHSTNKIIIRAVAALNKAVRAHAYSAMLSGFKVKSKAQFIANVISAKIKLPDWYGAKTSKQRAKEAPNFWNMHYHFHTGSYVVTECKLVYVRPQAAKGYGALLSAAEKLGEFSWAQLLLSVPHHAKKVAAAYKDWGKYSGYKKQVYRKDGSYRSQYVSFDSYANNYFNSYRAYFVKNRIIARVKGKRGIYTLTPNGKLLLSGMKQLDTMR